MGKEDPVNVMDSAVADLVLVKPTVRYMDAIASYQKECREYGGAQNGDSGLKNAEDIGVWIEKCRLCECAETVPDARWVEAEQFMLVRAGSERVLGMINFRHELNAFLAEYGGHIGYGVRPSERRRGYAKAMLGLCLVKCRDFGLERVLITVDRENEGSRRTVLACGGVYERDSVDGDSVLELYWVPCG